jgi:hypothetical protein
MEFHPLTEVFPPMSAAEFSALVEDIRAHGLREPITRWNGSILDGKHRYRACLEAGVEPRFQEWDGIGPPLAFVVSLNARRRHLAESQRAMVAARIANMRQGYRTDLRPSADLPEVVSQPEAAALLNVSSRLLRDARAVQRQGIPELVALVDRGELVVSEAVKIADLTPEKQQAILAKIAEGRPPVLARREVAFAGRPAPPFPTGKFGVIYADPPWAFEQAASSGRAPEDHYPTLLLEAICALPVEGIAAPDCVLFLWAPASKVEEALQAVRAWGFVYRTHMVWDKEIIGMGLYWRQRHEDLLLVW